MKQPKAKAPACIKVFTGILFICLLEIVLWSSCLAASSVAGTDGDSHSYLIRETGNLKLANKIQVQHKFPRADSALAFRLELSQLTKQQQQYLSVSSPERLISLLTLRLIEGTTTGPPAPYSGIKAIT